MPAYMLIYLGITAAVMLTCIKAGFNSLATRRENLDLAADIAIILHIERDTGSCHVRERFLKTAAQHRVCAWGFFVVALVMVVITPLTLGALQILMT